ncbi:MAG: hypothetical protein O2955_13900 [Planctomycetota bacterium]|nr:hypothetical protein [Planctomycetota bacterium]
MPRQFVREIRSEPRTREELLSVRLDGDVYAASHNDYRDLQVIDAAGDPVPYIIRQPMMTTTRDVQKNWQVENPSLIVHDDESLEITLTLKKDDPQPHGITIITPLRNFEQRVQVFGLADDVDESLLVSDAVIFDYARYMDVRQHEIRLPETTHRRFRVVIDRPTSVQESQLLELSRQFRGDDEVARNEDTTIERRPFRIDRIEFFRIEQLPVTNKSETMSCPVSGVVVKIDEEERQTLIDITSRREPITEFAMVTSSRNFRRSVHVQVPEISRRSTTWREIGHATISHLEFRDLHEEHLSVSFPPQREETYRIVIDNGDNMPLNIETVSAFSVINELVFLASPSTTYRLSYGLSPDAKPISPPSYDTAAIRAMLDKHIAPLPTELAAQTAAPPVQAASQLDFKSVVNNPWVLGTLVILLVVVLGCALYFAGRRFEQIPQDQ